MTKYVKTNAKAVANNIRNLTKHIREEGIDKAGDKFLPMDTQKIKSKLKEIMSEAQIAKPKDQNLPVELHNQPKAKNQLIKEIFNYDIAENHAASKFHSGLEDKVMMLYKDSNKSPDHKNAGASRGRLKISTEQYASYEEQLTAARNYFNNAVFVVQEQGEQKVYMNTGNVDMTDCVKVVCSQVGTNNPEHEAPSQDRFDRAAGQGEVEWTLFQDCVESKIKGQDGFTEITGMLDDIVDGDYTGAKEKTEQFNSGFIAETIKDKIDDIAQSSDVEPNTEALTKVVDNINSIKVTKEIKKSRTDYKVTGDLGSVSEAVSEAVLIALRETKLWAETSKALWAEKIGTEISKIVKDFWK